MCFKSLSAENSALYSKYFMVRQINPEISRKVSKSVKSFTYGNYIWTEILSMGPRVLKLYNTDFFAYRKKHFGPDLYNNYVQGYLPEKIINQANQINVNLENHDHDFKENAAYTAGLFKSYNNFRADPACSLILDKIMNGEIDQR
jgi:transketolase N-terminal domain/subunit